MARLARLARLVIPGLPHHITQRGKRRQQTFFNDGDYAAYLELMAQWCREEGVEIWSYCLMPNHVHLIAVPKREGSLRRAVGEAHRRYTRRINFREKWRGYLWQGRFASFVMDEPYLLAAARYVELNPLRAKLVSIGDGQRLEGLFAQCATGGATSGFAGTWAHRSATGQSDMLGSFGKYGWSRLETAKTRPKAKTAEAQDKKDVN